MSAITRLYDEGGTMQGMWCRDTGRAQLGTDFYVPERTCRVEGRVEQACPPYVVYGARLSCGHAFLMGDVPDFCPWCGARVAMD